MQFPWVSPKEEFVASFIRPLRRTITPQQSVRQPTFGPRAARRTITPQHFDSKGNELETEFEKVSQITTHYSPLTHRPLLESSGNWYFDHRNIDLEGEYQKCNVPQLKELLRERGLSVSGKKYEIIARLLKEDYDHNLVEINSYQARYVEMTVRQLKESLRKRGLSVSGKKYEIIARLVRDRRQYRSGRPGRVRFESDHQAVITLEYSMSR